MENTPNGHGPKEITNIVNRSRPKTKNPINETNAVYRVDISQEITRTVQSLKTDLERLTNRISSLEKSASNSAVNKQARVISFRNISPSLLAFLILWPFLTHSLIRYWSNKK